MSDCPKCKKMSYLYSIISIIVLGIVVVSYLNNLASYENMEALTKSCNEKIAQCSQQLSKCSNCIYDRPDLKGILEEIANGANQTNSTG